MDLDFEAGGWVTRHAEDVETAIYRIVQESLDNALEHAGTDAVVVDVVEAEGTIAVRVTDEGRGFDTASQGTGSG